MLARVLTATLKPLPWEGLLSCYTDEALSYLNQSVPLVIPILKIFFRLSIDIKSTKHTPILWWTIVELHHVLSVANFHHKLPDGTLKQHWLAFYGSILCMVTALSENVRDNCTMLTMPGQFCHTICTIPPVRNTILNNITADYLIIANLAIINLFS